ncbi:hypothetical protein ACIBUY_14385 [Streptomyces sp. NPDC050085]|uniref:allene oxide cyclase barrel-like domain-containing protein n=1 Tax=Streptomyces sp. NPDC050085 TaxID=3365600 RepID=UPI003798C55E
MATGKFTRLFAVSLVTAVIGIGVGGSADAGTSAKSRVEVLDLAVRYDQHEALDVGPAGPSLGDTNVYSGIAVQDGRDVGRGGGTCQVVRVEGTAATTQCLLTLETERGSLTMQSLWKTGGRGPLDMAITGGTGDFADARGTVRYSDIGTPDERARAEILH